MTTIEGKWAQVEGQPYPGLWFKFEKNGNFCAEFDEMGIVSSGTYSIAGDLIDIDQKEHNYDVIGLFEGVFCIEGETLKLALNQPGQSRETDFKKARIYERIV
ncbi:MAG: hypothetical protein JEZ06_14250 [Anaerolineaceae bacterium]|nr:hypothetical protein [Anaerolineaceae bacterium]